MIACDRPLVYRWRSNRFTCASLRLYINAAVLSAGAGESGGSKIFTYIFGNIH